jgi:hypothetical protein
MEASAVTQLTIQAYEGKQTLPGYIICGNKKLAVKIYL